MRVNDLAYLFNNKAWCHVQQTENAIQLNSEDWFEIGLFLITSQAMLNTEYADGKVYCLSIYRGLSSIDMCVFTLSSLRMKDLLWFIGT